MKKNVLVIVIALAVCAILLVVGLLLNQSGIAPRAAAPLDDELIVQTTPEVTSTAQVTASPVPEATAAPEVTATEASANSAPSAGGSIFSQQVEEPLYLVVTVNNMTYEPIPLVEDTEYTLTQQDGAMSNTVHVTKDSIYMEHSTCDNQDCVQQGEVTRTNRQTRILGNMIVCLPNRVTLQLCTAQDISQMLNY